MWRLRDIGELAESAFWKAAAESGAQPWLAGDAFEQQYISVALVGMSVEPPQCEALAGSSQVGIVMRDAVDARTEIAAKLRELNATVAG